MKYFFYPERRFVTFAPIMSNNPKSPIIDLQQQQLLLRMEYEYEKEEFKRQTETMGVARKVKRGLCWYPVSLGRSYYNSLNQLVIDITRTENKEIEHSFEFGRPVCFFHQSFEGKVKYMDLTVENGVTKAIRVDMGEPILTAAEVPVVSKNRQSIDEEITVENQTYRMTCVSMGNPHAVVFVDSTADLPLEQIGPHFEHHERFPRRTNTEFVEIVSPEYVKMRVWERGTGETLACGTGCCATAVACVLNGKTGRKVTVEVLGGALTIQWDEKTNHIFMTGPAEFVFDGELEYEV